MFEIRSITNCSERVLTSSPRFDEEEDASMDELGMPNSYFAHVSIVGPYTQENGDMLFKKVTNPQLFVDDVALSDINQGMIGDCWFLSAIDFSINHPLYKQTFKDTIQQDPLNPAAIQIKLYDCGTKTWQECFVDKRSCVTGSPIPIMVSVKSTDPNELWPMLLEKGLAKMCGGYPKIEGGYMSEGMCFLHGGRSFFISSKSIVPKLLSQKTTFDDLIADLQFLYSEGYGLFTAWEEDMFQDTREKGLVGGHAYSILDIIKVKDEWVFKLKNPWGTFEWKGEYSDYDKSETAELARSIAGMTSSNDGIFLISAADLFGRCEGLDIYEPLNKEHLSSMMTI